MRIGWHVAWLSLALLFGLPAVAATRYVGSCGTPNSATIAAAVTAAANGDTINICPGTYAEAVNVSKNNLTLQSSTNNAADVTVTNAGTPITLSGSTPTLRALTLVSTGGIGVSRPWTASPSAHLFEDLVITAKSQAINVNRSTALTFRNVTATSSNDTAIYVDYSANGLHVFEQVTATGKSYGIYVSRGASSFTAVEANATDNDAIYFGSLYPATLSTIKATSSGGRGIYIVWGTGAFNAMTLTDLTVSSKLAGIQIDQSGKVTIDNAEVSSSNGDGIQLNYGASGAHELSNIIVSAPGGFGLYAGYGLGTVADFAIASGDNGIYVPTRFDTAIARGTVSSSGAGAIATSSLYAKAFTVTDVTIESPSTGIMLTNNTQATIENVCVNRATDGVSAQWSASKVAVRNSRFSGYSGHGVSMGSSFSQQGSVSGSCFLKSGTPRAYSNSTVHTFDGNYWQGVAGGTNYVDGNVRDNATLASCPVTSCFAGALPNPLVEYHFDEAAWNGTGGEVDDSSTNGHDATAGGPANTVSGSPAYTAGAQGTCGYGRFDLSGSPRAYVQLPVTFPPLSASFTVTAWIRTTDRTKIGQRVFVRDDNGNGWALSVSDEVAGTVRVFNRNITYTAASLTGGGAIRAGNVALDTPVVISNNTWYFLAAAVDTTSRTVTIHVYDASGSQLAKTSASYTGTWGAGTGATSIGNETSASGENGLYFTGNIDEVRVYQSIISEAQVESVRTLVRTCPTSVDHVELVHDGLGLTCSGKAVKVQVCTAAESCHGVPANQYTAGSVAVSLTSIAGAQWCADQACASLLVNPVNVANGDTIYLKDTNTRTDRIAGTATGATNSAVQCYNTTTSVLGSTTACDVVFSSSGFVFTVPDHVADTPQTVSVSAVKQSDGTACVPAFASVTRTLTFGCSHADPSTGTSPVVVGGTSVGCGGGGNVSLAFDAGGVASTTVRYADVGRMSLTASYTGTGPDAGLSMAGSDSFVAAPASFAVTASGPYVAGSPFGTRVEARNASGTVAANFGKESSPETVVLRAVADSGASATNSQLVGPAGGATGTLTPGAFAAANCTPSSAGSVCDSALTWTEVGDLVLAAALSSGNYLGSGLAAWGSGAAGPFRPAYLESAIGAGCVAGGFTYSAQPFALTVTARNAFGAPTQNYAGTYAKAAVLSDANGAAGQFKRSAAACSPTNRCLVASDYALGVADFAATPLVAFEFATKPTPPTAVQVRITDTDGVTSSGHAEGTMLVRSGRLRLLNAYGTDLLPLRVEGRAEYWDDGHWKTNVGDTCTQFAAGSMTMSGGIAMNACFLATASNPGNGGCLAQSPLVSMASGRGNWIVFDKTPTQFGFTDLTLAVPVWLRGNWLGGSYVDSPVARIKFGTAKMPYIYLRERF